MIDSTFTRLGYKNHQSQEIDSLRKTHTLISLCSRNCRITFRRYSRLTSSSLLEDVDDSTAGEATREMGSEGAEDIDDLGSAGALPLEVQ